MSRWGKLNFAQKTCVASAGRLMQQTGMLQAGARVGVAVSGGMDSLVLLKVLTYSRRIAPFSFELMAIHLNPGFSPANHAPLLPWLREEGLSAHVELTDYGTLAHSPVNRKNSPCFYCCWRRRKRLFDLAAHYGLTHLAFGHNADDLVGTFFLNLVQTGRVDGMGMRESFFGGRLTLIRPLLWLEKAAIRKACAAWGLPVWENPCPSAQKARRAEMMRWLETAWGNNRRIRQNVFNALRRWQLDADREST